jgi:hypothetical protein
MADAARWRIRVDYVESCNCSFGCPCNFTGFPTGGFCRALVGYRIKEGHHGSTGLAGLDVIYAAAWPGAIHQGGGALRLYIAEAASEAQRGALVRIFSGEAGGNGPFAVFASTLAEVQAPVFAPIEMRIDGCRSSFRVPGACEVELAPFRNPVSGEVQDVRVQLPAGFIWRTAQAARTLVMQLFGGGTLSFDHSGQNAFFAADLEFAGP